VAGVAARVFPSLVTITVRGAGGSGVGSGSVLDTQGNILTNDHVIEAAADTGSITVDFAPGAHPGSGAHRRARPGDRTPPGRAVSSVDEMLVAVRGHNPGDAVPITYVRNGSPRDGSVVVGGGQ
jgi:S1-C subfamily serine protease